ncbi:MAG: TolC family outer membrane protein [Xanthomonadales bacterium]|nr:TolC family outer membrane protein [Xanthomonadales bacterium]NNL94267.1 TolC family outer membrane protein [Xanthomonadales bacterium]
MAKPIYSLAIAIAGILAAPAAEAVDIVGVYELAQKNDPQLLAAKYRRDATAESRAQARANLLPTLTATGSATRGDSETSIAGTLISDVDTDNESLSLDLSQTLYNRANYEQLDIARGQVSQGEAIYQQAYQDFLVRVADAYFNVLTAIDGVTFAEAEEKALQRQFEQAEQRFEVGLTAVTDVHEARASYDNARARAIVSRNSLADTKEGLRELTGQYFSQLDPLQAELPLQPPTPATAEDWVAMALETNPAVQSAHFAVDIAEGNAGLQRAGHWPSLSLTASVSEFTNNEFLIRDDFQNPIGTTSLEVADKEIGIRLNIPIYQGGAVTSRTRQARAELNAAQQDLDAQQRATVRQTQNAFRSVIAGIQQVEAFGQALVSAESALEATQAGFEVGTRTIVDVLIAEQRYFQAQRDNSNARHSYIVDHLRLKAAAGVLTGEDLGVVNQILD